MKRLWNALSGLFWTLWNVFWGLALAVLGLWAFFLAMGGFSLTDPLWLTGVMVVLAITAIIHFIHVREALSDHQHDDIARVLHRMRERRGF